MKKILHLSIFTFFTMSLFAQDITVDPTMVEFIFNDQDLSNSLLDLEKHVTITNNTAEAIALKWIRVFPEDCPTKWESQVCDNNTCYAEFISSNVDSSIPIDAPFILGAEESFDGFIFHVKPKGGAGCCMPKIHFERIDTPGEIIATIDIDVRINDEECLTSSVDEVTKAALKVYPNPMTDNFRLAGNEDNVVKELVVYNLIGRSVRVFNAEYESNFDMNGLPGGIYLISLLGEGNEILKTVRVSRHLMRP